MDDKTLTPAAQKLIHGAPPAPLGPGSHLPLPDRDDATPRTYGRGSGLGTTGHVDDLPGHEARTLGRVTGLSNVGDPVEDGAPPADEVSALPAIQPPPPSAGLRSAELTRSSIAAEQLPLRTTRPANTKTDDGWTWWLWALAAAALVLLLPIMLLLTRPTRGN